MLLAAAVCAWPAEDDWANLAQLKAGDRVAVVNTSMATANGEFRASGADSLTVAVDGQERRFERTAVVRVSRLGHAHRVRNAVILGAAGGVAGAAAFRFGNGCAETNDGCRNAAMASIGGAGAGAALGALLPARPHVVYRVSSLPRK